MIQNTLRNLSLRSKIMLGHIAAFAFTSVVVACAFIYLVDLGNATDAILRENYRSIHAAAGMTGAIVRGMLGTLLRDVAPSEGNAVDADADFLLWYARAKDNITIAGEGELIAEIGRGYRSWRAALATLTGSSASFRGDATVDTLRRFEKLRDDIASLERLNEKAMRAASEEAANIARKSISYIAIAGVVVGSLILLLGLAVSDRIMRPIRGFRDAARSIAWGDYAVKVHVETGDELEELATEFNRMAERLLFYKEMNIDEIVSERNKGEAILASIDDGIIVFTTDLNISGLNPAARRMLKAEFYTLPDLDAAALLPGPAIHEALRELMTKGTPPELPVEARIVEIPEGGKSRQYLFSVNAIRGRERDLAGAVLLLRDVTHLREAERMKNEFIAAASHELRTPLTSIGMSVELLREHAACRLADDDRELLEAAHEEIKRMSALVDDLLDLSKIESGRIDLSFERVETAHLFDRVADIFRGQAERRCVKILVEQPADLRGTSVRADAHKLLWVLTNLVSNALRYVSDDGFVRLAAHRRGGNVHVTVEDDGLGIPPVDQERIFQKFVQVQGRPAGGAGLGLAICREIVRAHGGSIWVESREGEGSVFTVSIPAADS